MPLSFWISLVVIVAMLALWVFMSLVEGGEFRRVYFQVPRWIGAVVIVAGLIVTFALGLGTNVKNTSTSYGIEWDGRSNPLRRD